MNNKEAFKNYVKNGGEQFICSPQIGGGAGFDAKIKGKEWLGEITPFDTKDVCEMFDMIPLYNFCVDDFSCLTPQCSWETVNELVDEKGRRVKERVFKTPKGNLTSKSIEERKNGSFQTKYPITEEAELDILEYFVDCISEVTDFSPLTGQIAEIRRMLGDSEALSIQWAMQPYELFGFPNTMDTAIFAIECPNIFKRLMDKILKINEKLIKAAAAGGTDFVFLGGPGSEMISPKFYEEFLVPYSKIVSEMAHKEGLLIYSHICSPIEPMLTAGYYNQMGIDLFETLSGPPVGNIKGVEDAFRKLSDKICTRGNVGLDLLLTGTPEEIKKESLAILEVAKKMGRKHILAASDYLFYNVPAESVRAMCEAVKEFNNGKKS